MSHPYIPRRQNSLLAMARNAEALLSAAPFRYGVTPEQARYFQQFVDDFDAKMAVVSNPRTDTKGTVRDKDVSALRLLAVMRPLFQTIKLNAGVMVLDKAALGIAPLTIPRREVPAPVGAPELQVPLAMALRHTLRYFDPAAPQRRAKPDDVTALELVCLLRPLPEAPGAEGGEQGLDVREARLVALVTRQPYVVCFTPAEAGLRAYYWGRWVTRRGKPGPWSLRVSRLVTA